MSLKTKLELALLLVVGAALFAPSLWLWDLWDPDEPRYVQVSHEMAASGDLVTLHFNGQPYYNKPPLFFWLDAASIRAFRNSTFAARLPTVLLAIGGLILCYGIAGLIGAHPLTSSLVLATCEGYVREARRATLDTALVFFILLAVYLYLLGTRKEKGNELGSALPGAPFPFSAITCFLAAAVAIGLGVLTKGHYAVLAVVCAVIPYLVWRRGWKELFRWRWVTGLAIILAVSLAWFLPALQREGPTLFRRMIENQIGGRLTESEFDPEPFYQYLRTFPIHFMPWVLYLPFALVYVWRRRQAEPFLAFTWFIFFFIVLSAVPSKLDRYMLPLYPPAALIVGYYLRERPMNRAGLVAIVAGLLCAAGGVTWAITVERQALVFALVGGAIVTPAAVAGLVLWRRWGYRSAILAACVFFFAVGVAYNPYKNTGKSIRPLAEYLQQHGATAKNIIWYRGAYHPAVAYYTGSTVMRTQGSRGALGDCPRSWIITTESDARKMSQVLAGIAPTVTFGYNRGHSESLLVFKTPN